MDGIGLYHNFHKNYNHLCMPGYYETIDALLVTSDYEACGLPAMEAAAAGRLVVSAAVGYFDGSSGALCRTPEDEFVEDARRILEEHKDPIKYRETCERAQQYARDHYDWSHVVDGWIDLLNI
jgi:glycosyltransferase involved in cell wall biosynthesis